MKISRFALFLSLVLVAEAANSAPVKRYSAPRSQAPASHHETFSAPASLARYSAEAGTTFVGGAVAGNVGVKSAFHLASRMPLYLEPSLDMLFNSDFVGFPVRVGGRYDFAIRGNSKLVPFGTLSMGPGFATRGQKVSFTMFAGPGAIYRMSGLDLRTDLGFVMFRDKPGFQLQAGVAL